MITGLDIISLVVAVVNTRLGDDSSLVILKTLLVMVGTISVVDINVVIALPDIVVGLDSVVSDVVGISIVLIVGTTGILDVTKVEVKLKVTSVLEGKELGDENVVVVTSMIVSLVIVENTSILDDRVAVVVMLVRAVMLDSKTVVISVGNTELMKVGVLVNSALDVVEIISMLEKEVVITLNGIEDVVVTLA